MTSNPKRIQMSRQHPWRAENPDAVIVARPSKWGNPFRVGSTYLVLHNMGWGVATWREAGPFNEFGEVVKLADSEQAVEMFRHWMHSCLTTAKHKTDISPLRGHDLACWCPLDQPCHADVLLELANPVVSSTENP